MIRSDLADAIDGAFARWDRSHLQDFTLADGTRLCLPDPDWRPRARARKITGASGCHGCAWAGCSPTCSTSAITGHTCARSALTRSTRSKSWQSSLASPCRTGAGETSPDQYRRRWDGDDGESPMPPDPGLADLPPLLPHWGPGGGGGAGADHARSWGWSEPRAYPPGSLSRANLTAGQAMVLCGLWAERMRSCVCLIGGTFDQPMGDGGPCWLTEYGVGVFGQESRRTLGR